MAKYSPVKFVRNLAFVFLVLFQFGKPDNSAYAVSFEVTVDTSSLAGVDGQLAFDLIDGDGATNNSVLISDFVTDGTLGSASVLGGVSGSLPGSVTISDTDFFNELLQGINLGDLISFTLDVTTNFAGGVPDSFSFFILDSTALISLVTTDLLGNALFVIDIDGTATGALSVASLTEPTLLVGVTAVPEPSSILLLAVALPLFFKRIFCVRI